MKKDIFIIFLILPVFSLAAPCFALDPSTPEEALDSAQQERSARPAVGLPQWKASLGDIQQTTADLIAINAKLTAEYQQLDQEIKTTGQAILAQKDQNKEHLLNLMQRQHDLDAPVVAAPVEAGSVVIERAVLQKREALQLLRARARGLQNRLDLQRIKARELEVEKKTLMVDLKTNAGVSAEDTRIEIEDLKKEITSQLEEEKGIWDKIRAMPREDGSGLTPVQSLAFETADMKQQLADVSAQEQAASAKVAEIRSRRKTLASDPMIAKYNNLTEEKKQLSARIVEQQQNISNYENDRNAGRRTISDLKDKAEATEKQNAALEAEIENLRENIALLEYKINSMQSYQDRNKKGR